MIDLGEPLKESDFAGLQASFISPDLAKQAGLFRVDSVIGAQLIGRNGSGNYSGIAFPYYLPDESLPREYRLRRDYPDFEQKSDGSIKEKGKYLSPPGRSNLLYFVPGTQASWLHDNDLQILITEGEKKALALFALAYYLVAKGAQPRFLPFGISGVWNWRGVVGKITDSGGHRRDVKGAIPDLDRINWKGRKVLIVFDSNVATNPSVSAARIALAKELESRGAAVYFVSIPEEDGINGVDDLLAAKGEGFVLGLIAASRPFAEIKETRYSARTGLLRITEDLDLFCSDDEGFATIPINDHKETYSLRSKAMRQWLAAKMYEIEGKGANVQAIQEVIDILQGRARHQGIERTTFRRIAEADGKIYIDLCNNKWQAIEINQSGWGVMSDCPVVFLRSKGMLALPEPVQGGSLDELREFVNVGSDEDFALLKGWLVQTVRFDVPFALLSLGGEQGSAKSTTASILRSLIDPNPALLRRPPKDERDLIAAARNGWIIALNNLSSVPVWLSDSLCQLSVDGGFASRELYTDGEEFILKARRPIILTSIEDIIGKSDLLDRTVSIIAPPIPGNKRIDERDLWTRFRTAQPKLLGALCDYACTALKNLPNTKIANLPRMADFAEWGVAAEGKNEQTSIFLRAYRTMRQTNNQAILESSPLAAVLQRFIQDEKKWSGTAKELLSELDDLASEKERNRKSYPKAPNFLSNKLRELAPNIRENGIHIEFGSRQGKKGAKIINIEQIGNTSSASSDSEALYLSSSQSGNDLEADDKPTMADDGKGSDDEVSSASYVQQDGWLSGQADDTDDADDNFPSCSDNAESQLAQNIPATISQEMRRQLLDMGYVDWEIERMTPKYAYEIIGKL